jgi:hypothetical protein
LLSVAKSGHFRCEWAAASKFLLARRHFGRLFPYLLRTQRINVAKVFPIEFCGGT